MRSSLLGLFFLLIPAALHAQRLTGTILHPNGTPVDSGRVTLFRQDERLIQQRFAGAEGFSLDVPVPGAYLAFVSTEDYGLMDIALLAENDTRIVLTAASEGEMRLLFGSLTVQAASPAVSSLAQTYLALRQEATKTPMVFDRAKYLERLRNAQSDVERDLLRLLYGRIAGPKLREAILSDSLLLTQLNAVPPTSEAWVLLPGQFAPMATLNMTAQAVSEEEVRVYTERMSAHPSRAVQASALLMRLRLARNDDEAEVLFAESAAYDDIPGVSQYRLLLDPNKPIQVGRVLPHLRLTTVMGETLDTRALPGRLILLDGWATWCGPCLAEMPYLHDAHQRFADDGFTIVSLNFDDERTAGENYRAGEWKMPWHHVWPTGGLEGEPASRLTIQAMPWTVLVNQDGRILAMDEALRGERLAETLERLLHQRP